MDDEAVKARPILFSGTMVRALLEGRKTQTRRILKSPVGDRDIVFLPEHYETEDAQAIGLTDDRNNPYNFGIVNYIEFDPLHLPHMTCPYGQPGDLLWVRESFSYDRLDIERNGFLPPWYWADGNPVNGDWSKPKPSIHMPRWASRLTLEIMDVRVQRLHEITEEDAICEGIVHDGTADYKRFHVPGLDHPNKNFPELSRSNGREMYAALWDTINGSGTWLENSWVWALSFKVDQKNVDAFLQSREAA